MEAHPIYDVESENRQDITGRADEIYALNLRHIDAYIVSQAVTWAYGRDRKEMSEIADSLKIDNAYVGALLVGLVKDYLADYAFRQAEKEVADERNDG